MLDEAPTGYDLEDITPEAVLDTFAYVGLMLLVGERAGARADGVEGEGRAVGAVEQGLDAVQAVGLAVLQELGDVHGVSEVIEDDNILVQDVENVGSVVALSGFLRHRYVLEIFDCVKGGIAVEPAVSSIVSCDVILGEEVLEGLLYGVLVGDVVLCGLAVGILHEDFAVIDSDAGERVKAYVGMPIGLALVVAALHQKTLGIEIADFHVGVDGSVSVGEDGALGDVDVVYGGGLKKTNSAMLASIPEISGGLIALTRFEGSVGFYPEEYLEIVQLYLSNL